MSENFPHTSTLRVSAAAAPLARVPFRAILATLLGVAFLFVMMSAVGVVTGLAIAVAAAWAAVVVREPQLALLVAFVPVVMTETSSGQLASAPGFYASLPIHVTPAELLLLLALTSALTHENARKRLLGPAPLVAALLLVAGAAVFGLLVGVFAHASTGEAQLAAHPLLAIALVPLIVVNAIRTTADLRRAIGVIAVLTIAKAVLGLIALVVGLGYTIEGQTLTYYEPAANFLMMIFLFAVAGALVGRVRVPLWILAATPLVVTALLLSYRRSFWIATVAGLLLVVVFASGRGARPLALGAVIVVGVAVWLSSTIGLGRELQLQGPVATRVQSLAPSRLAANPQDRYRLEERRNVLDELNRHPVTGLGLAVPWTARHPLSLENTGGRQYVHMDLLWFWLKAGVVGLAAYLTLMALVLRGCTRVWRLAKEPHFRLAALAFGCGTIGLAIVETTASFTGADARFSILFAFLIGLLAAAWRLTPAAEAGRLTIS